MIKMIKVAVIDILALWFFIDCESRLDELA